jgi:O-antigen/teichoic acid export membrane protein
MARLTSLSDKAGVISIGLGVASGITFVSGIFLVRLVSKDDYGTYVQVLLAYSILEPILIMGIPKSIYYFMPRLPKDEQKAFAWQSITVSFFLGFIMGLILYTSSGMFSNRFHNPALKPLLHIYFLFPLLHLPTNCLIPLLIVANKHIRAAIMQVIFVILVEPLSVLIPLALGYNLPAVFRMKVFFAGVNFLLVIWHLVKIYGLVPPRVKTLLSQLKYSAPLGLSAIAGRVNQQLDKIVISIFFSVASFAIYTRGAFEIPFTNVLAMSVMNVIMSELSKLHKEHKYDEFLRLWHESIRKVALILFPFFAFLFIFAKPLITILYSANYVDSTGPFRIYIFLIPSRITVYGSVLLAMGYSHLVLAGSMLAMVLSVIFNILGIKLIGFYGPAVAFVISTYALILFYLMKTKNTLRVKLSRVFPWFSLVRIMAVSCFVGVCVYPISFLALPRLLILSLAGVIYALLYISCSLKLGIIRREDLDLVKRWVTL